MYAQVGLSKSVSSIVSRLPSMNQMREQEEEEEGSYTMREKEA
jgi:hypothetical protein